MSLLIHKHKVSIQPQLLQILQSLLNVLKSLDLSHNKIQECAEFLKVGLLSAFGYIESKLYLFILQFTVILFYFIFAFAQALTELEHLNLGYNCLQRAPMLGMSARAKLVTLILRNNELETINGRNNCYQSQASRTLLKAQFTFSAKRPNSDEAGR